MSQGSYSQVAKYLLQLAFDAFTARVLLEHISTIVRALLGQVLEDAMAITLYA